jgi:hypothetical protein
MSDPLLQHVREMRRALTNHNVPIQVALIEAGRILRQAVSNRSQWPPDLLARADRLLGRLFALGTLEASIAHADAQTVRQLGKDVFDLVADIDDVRSEDLLRR